MKLFSTIAGVALLALMAPTTFAAVAVKTAEKTYTGDRVVKMTSTLVTIIKGALEIPISVNKITEIRYSKNTRLERIRKFAASGRYEDAVEELDKFKGKEGLIDYVVQDIEFYRAFCRGQMALGGTVPPATAVKELRAFTDNHPNNYHVLQCGELLGRLEVALEHYEKAEEYYAVLARTPWIDYQIRAFAAVGESRVAQGNFIGAMSMFEKALAIKADDTKSQLNQQVALIGKGRCQAETGSVAAGIATINKVIKDVGPEARMLLPRAYLALGYCHKKDGKPQEAVLQFLMVDLVYNTHRASHADALKNLVDLWQSINKIENSRKAKARLQQLYPGVG